MSNPTTSTAARPRSRGRALALRLTLTVLGLLLASAMIIYWVSIFGYISGEEFSPETFQRRSFRYYQVPIIGVQILPTKRSPIADPLASHLLAQRYIPRDQRQARWDLVVAYRGQIASLGYGDAHLLVAYLELPDEEGDSHWLHWTEEHPELAKVFWPAVAELARERLYFFVPELTQLALQHSTPQDLQAAIDRLLVRRYARLAAVQQRFGAHERALVLCKRALEHDPGDAETLRARARSLQAMGKRAQAAADLKRAAAAAKPQSQEDSHGQLDLSRQ